MPHKGENEGRLSITPRPLIGENCFRRQKDCLHPPPLQSLQSQRQYLQIGTQNLLSICHRAQFPFFTAVADIVNTLSPDPLTIAKRDNEILIMKFNRFQQAYYSEPFLYDNKAKYFLSFRNVGPRYSRLCSRTISNDQEHKKLKQKYQLNGIFHPLDILDYEIYTANISDNDAQRFLYMIHDVRSLLLNVTRTLNRQDNRIASSSINQSFSLPSQSSDINTLCL
ncbi:hypothetical protein EDC96DRAFT_542389 [Choanephora cucurbitarum]|nr:hypothetical protein EDC96DRAFT_542389 [Choanephora cucurbitarum]